jgi:hypothetical protein
MLQKCSDTKTNFVKEFLINPDNAPSNSNNLKIKLNSISLRHFPLEWDKRTNLIPSLWQRP